MRAELERPEGRAHRRRSAGAARRGGRRAGCGRGRARRGRPPTRTTAPRRRWSPRASPGVDQSGRSLTLSGQVNPAFNVVDDGISTDVFIVDNDTSGTRFRLDADAPLGETSLGATIEIGASPNNSYDVIAAQLADRRRLQRPPRRGDLPQRPLRPAAARQGLERRGRHRRVRSLAGGRPDHVRRRRRHRRRHHLHRRHRAAATPHGRRRLLRLRRRPAGAHPLRQPDVRSGPGLGVLRPGRPVGGGGHPRRRLRRLERLDGRQLHHARRRLGLQHRRRQRRLRLRRLGLVPARSDRPQPDALDRRSEARRGRRSVEPLRQDRLGHRVLAARPDRLRHRLHPRARTSAARAPRARPTASPRCSGSSATGSTSTASSAGTSSTAAPSPT